MIDEPLLVVEDLRSGYGKHEVIVGASLTVGAGEIVSLVGPNSAGKSTLLLAIGGVLRVCGGSVRFRGDQIRNKLPRELVAMGLVLCPEAWKVFPQMTVRENLKTARAGSARFHDRPKLAEEHDLSQALEWFPELRDKQAQRGATLSGGERQMVALARALLLAPRLVLLDEPMLGLAPRVIGRIADVIQRLAAGGLGVVITEQAGKEAPFSSKRVVRFAGGRCLL